TKVFAFAACSAGFVFPLDTFADSYRPRVGQRHPDFTLPAISDGKPVSLSQYRGKKVLLIQFASW
ncbi:MAG: redoxin domain-containing protein, partial [Planctomycetes bacterium]|nr:redoxin domain-containing protein [Planctomycetota bacterium]